MVDAVIGLGSSLGGREDTLRLAVQALDAAEGVEVSRVARLYRTQPMGAATRWFLNSAVRVRTRRSPRGLLDLCKSIERRLGRRPSARWSDRALDLDILLFGGHVRRGAGLTLPHPGLLERSFALVPALEVAPDLVHPIRGCRLDRIPLPAGPAPAVCGTLSAPALARSHAPQYTGRGQGSRSARMKLFLDTANLDEIREVASWGILDGVTTNPTLIAREGRDFVETIHEICEIVQGPVSAEAVSRDAEGLIREGRLLAQVHEHIVVKVPMSVEGLKATRVLSDEGIDVNVTLIFQPAQALLAARAGAAYVSPFLGRLDDLGQDGVDMISQCARIVGADPELGTSVLAASIRNPGHAISVALAGADVATIPYKVFRAMLHHPLTEQGLNAFLEDWSKTADPDITGQVTRWLARRGSRA